MGFFGNKIRKVLQEFRLTSESRSNDLNREIKEFLDELEEDYEENRGTATEFSDFVQSVKSKLGDAEAGKLEEFAQRFSKIDRAARHGVESMRELMRDQRRLSRETIREFEEYGYQA